MADTSPPVPGRSEVAFPVPGGWVQQTAPAFAAAVQAVSFPTKGMR